MSKSNEITYNLASVIVYSKYLS